MLLFIYWQYLRLRYMLSGDTKIAFARVHAMISGYLSYPQVPAIIRNGYFWIANKLTQMNDPEYMAQQQQQMGRCNIQ